MCIRDSSSIVAPRDNTCDNFPGLVDQQKSLCLQNPQALLSVSQGAKKAIYECQAQFSSERWNCTLSANYSIFGHVLKKGRYNYLYDCLSTCFKLACSCNVCLFSFLFFFLIVFCLDIMTKVTRCHNTHLTLFKFMRRRGVGGGGT